MDSREAKAVALTGDERITFAGGVWSVPSQTRPRVRYEVNPSKANPSCTCRDWELTHRECKHIQAVRLLLGRQIEGEPAPVPPPLPPRPTYKQRWGDYNEAQAHEKDHFQELLADLCRAIPQPPPKGGSKGGRPPVPLAEAVFAACYKVFSTMSGRRFMSDFREAAERGHARADLSFNVAFRCLQNPAVTPILEDLIRRSSLPLRSVEVDFAIDSTGFSTNKFTKWYSEKYEAPQEKCEWVKAHCCVGTKTNVITAAFVGDKNAGDSPQLPGLLKATAEGFTVRELSADKAYLSGANLELVDSLGGTAYIPFKVNSVLGNTPLWDRMFHYFNMRRDEFLQHYFYCAT
jgi:hypothetical protein